MYGSNLRISARRIAVVFSMVIAVTCSCGRDRIDDAGGAASPYRDLTAKDDVLFNLSKSYELRDSSAYAGLLDPAFEFIFFSEDSLNMLTPERWPRSSELQATGRIFSGSGSGTNLACPEGAAGAHARRSAITMRWGVVKSYMLTSGDSTVSLNLLIYYAEGDSAWTPVPALDKSLYGNETWYRKRVECSLFLKTGRGKFLVVQRMPAEFFVRHAPATGDSIWSIVQWYDYALQ